MYTPDIIKYWLGIYTFFIIKKKKTKIGNFRDIKNCYKMHLVDYANNTKVTHYKLQKINKYIRVCKNNDI